MAVQLVHEGLHRRRRALRIHLEGPQGCIQLLHCGQTDLKKAKELAVIWTAAWCAELSRRLVSLETTMSEPIAVVMAQRSRAGTAQHPACARCLGDNGSREPWPYT